MRQTPKLFEVQERARGPLSQCQVWWGTDFTRRWAAKNVESVCLSVCLFVRHACKRHTPFTRYNRLSNRLYNGFNNQLYRVNKHSTGCPTGCQTSNRFDNRFDNRVERTATVRSTGCQTGLYNQFRFENRLYTRYSRLSNRLYRVYTIQSFIIYRKSIRRFPTGHR